MQGAHTTVMSYPGHADIIRIAEVLAQQAGEPMSDAVMASAAAEAQGTQLPIDQALPHAMRLYVLPSVDLGALYSHLLSQQLQPHLP